MELIDTGAVPYAFLMYNVTGVEYTMSTTAYSSGEFIASVPQIIYDHKANFRPACEMRFSLRSIDEMRGFG